MYPTPQLQGSVEISEAVWLGAVAQGVAGFLTNPVDVLKTKVQSGVSSGMRAAVRDVRKGGAMVSCKYLWYISQILQLTAHKLSAEPRNRASAEALAVARRPREASRRRPHL